MAQKIVNLCDPHLLEHDEEVAGEPYRIGLCPPGQRWQWVTIDLCPADAGALAELGAWLVKYGRTNEPPQAFKGARWDSPAVAKPGAPRERHECPICGFVSISRNALGAHTRQKHGKGLTELEPGSKPLEHECDICGRKFGAKQGLAVHKHRSHPPAE